MKIETFFKYSPVDPSEMFDGDKVVPRMDVRILRILDHRVRSDVTPLRFREGEDGMFYQQSLLTYINQLGSQHPDVRIYLLLLSKEYLSALSGVENL